MSTELPAEVREMIEQGPLAFLTTINADGSPQMTAIWIGLDGDQIVSGHMSHHLKLRNIERDPRVVLAFSPPGVVARGMSPYVMLKATAKVEHSDTAWDLLDRLAKVYMGPDKSFPAPRGPGYIARYEVEKVSGIGRWARG